MTPSEPISISQVAELLARHGYDTSEPSAGLLRIRDVQSGVTFQAALEGNVLYMTVNLMSIAERHLSPNLMARMLSAENGISTSGFKLYDAGDGRIAITLNNFCKLQDMGAEDEDDILSLAGYLMADVVSARDLLEPEPAAA
jgi:hypothetical protein